MTSLRSLLDRAELKHSARTAIAASVSLVTAGLFQLPEAYWAAITTMIVTQSSVGAALTVSGQRIGGTALGVSVGAVFASRFQPNAFTFAAGIFVLGILTTMLRRMHPRLRETFDWSAYRFAGVSLAVVYLIARPQDAWTVAFHRFAEISIGLAVALVLALVWPESETH